MQDDGLSCNQSLSDSATPQHLKKSIMILVYGFKKTVYPALVKMNTDDFNRLLITFLANETCLYDVTSPLFNNINERHQAYVRIGRQLQECGASNDQANRVNDKFQGLKRRFFNEHRKVQKGSASSWPYYASLERLLGKLVDRQTSQPNVEADLACSGPEISTQILEPPVIETKKRKIALDDVEITSRPDFAGIFDYLSIKLKEMDGQTQKNVIEKLLRIVHNPSICLVDDHQLPQNIANTNQQWSVAPNRY